MKKPLSLAAAALTAALLSLLPLSARAAETTAQSPVAVSTPQSVEVDGAPVDFQTYALLDQNGYQTNYAKLRDVAYALNGTAAQFNVDWTPGQGVSVTTQAPYTTQNGAEMTTPYSGDQPYTVPTEALTVDGRPVWLDAIRLTDADGNGYTYFKLRDLGQALGFTVDWTPQRGVYVETSPAFHPETLPEYQGVPYVEVNGNQPFFTSSQLQSQPFEAYSPLDDLGRCGPAWALVGEETMPTAPRGEIGQIKPSGWHTVRYDGLVDGNYLYNRCHLLGYQLTGENANPQNLITGTRYLNTQGMLPFENQVADYVEETGGHVLYRVTPVFEGDDLLARGVLMEARSVEDGGQGLTFCVYAYNVQPGISIRYSDGESALEGASALDPASDQAGSSEDSGQVQAGSSGDSGQVQAGSSSDPAENSASDYTGDPADADYVVNQNTKVFHLPDCSSVQRMKESNKLYYQGPRNALVEDGYTPCKVCSP